MKSTATLSAWGGMSPEPPTAALISWPTPTTAPLRVLSSCWILWMNWRPWQNMTPARPLVAYKSALSSNILTNLRMWRKQPGERIGCHHSICHQEPQPTTHLKRTTAMMIRYTYKIIWLIIICFHYFRTLLEPLEATWVFSWAGLWWPWSLQLQHG